MNKVMAFADYNILSEGRLQEIIEMKMRDLIKWVNRSKKTEEPKKMENAPQNSDERTKKKDNSDGKTGASKFVHDVAVNAIGGIVVAVVIAVWAGFTGIYNNIKSIPDLATKEDIENMVTTSDIENMVTTSDIENMVVKDDIKDTAKQNDIETLTKQIDNISQKYDNLNRSVGVIEGRLGIPVNPNAGFISKLTQTYASYDTVYNESTNNVWSDLSQEVGTDLTTGAIYTAEDLENETVILSYFDENNNEVYFKGKYNEDNKWEGNCIINKYSDGNLKYIMNADYESGKLVAYKQVFSYINSANMEVWAISSRTVEEEGNAGQTWTFFKEREWKKDFEKNYLKAENIINEEYFYNIMDLNMEGYYNGYTSDGYFNDENKNGNAYMIKYNEDGYVRMLYSGQFASGLPHDLTGNAFVIALGRDGTSYYYYDGKIEDFSQIEELWRKIEIEEIKQRIKGINYDGSLNWYGEIV